MAMLNELLGVAARFNQLLYRKFYITGGAPSPQLTPEVTPVEVMGSDVADRVLMGERLFERMYYIANGGAGAYPQMQIRNPANSGVLVILEAILISHNGAAAQGYSINSGSGTVDLANAFEAVNRDTRQLYIAGVGSSGAKLSYRADGGAAAIGNEIMYLNPGLLHVLSVDYILSPGYYLYIGASQDNIAGKYGFRWRERPVGSLELQL